MTDWRTILADYGPAVWQTVYRLLGQHANALDCYQDTFLAAWRYAERWAVTAWAPTRLRNRWTS
jgi:DNA-directed RNA polymerase specialized sigma24 family protein